jgi:hypothetical protein
VKRKTGGKRIKGHKRRNRRGGGRKGKKKKGSKRLKDQRKTGEKQVLTDDGFIQQLALLEHSV